MLMTTPLTKHNPKFYHLKQEKNVRYIFRKEKNLSTAFLEGVKISKGKYVVLMDADLQHSPSI